MYSRYQGNCGTRHIGNSIRPDTTGNDYIVRCDGPFVCNNSLGYPIPRDGTIFGQDIDNFGISENTAANCFNRLFTHGCASLKRIHHRDRGAIETPKNDIIIDKAINPLYVCGR